MNPVVYVVDDDQEVRTSLQRSLGGLGYTVETFPSADRFFERYERNGPGCLVLDLIMPGMHGLDALDRIPPDDPLRVVILTGYGDVSAAVRAMKAGAVDFLEKPVRPERLADVVAHAVRSSEVAAARAGVTAQARTKLATLTRTEMIVLERLVEGQTTREIATALHRSTRTIGNHRQRILTKMSAKNTAELLRAVATLHDVTP